MSWHEGEGKAARIRVPPAVAYTKGRYTLGAVGQESAVKTSVASKMPSRVSAAASGAVCQWQTSSTDRRGSGDRALNGAHWAPAPPPAFFRESWAKNFPRLRRARELMVRTGVSVAHRPRARIVPCGHAPRIAWGATPAN